MSDKKLCPLKVASGKFSEPNRGCESSCAWNVSNTISHPECALVTIAKSIKKNTY